MFKRNTKQMYAKKAIFYSRKHRYKSQWKNVVSVHCEHGWTWQHGKAHKIPSIIVCHLCQANKFGIANVYVTIEMQQFNFGCNSP